MERFEKRIKNQNVRRFIQIIQRRYMESDMTSSSTAVAYYLLLSIFPLVIAIGSILPFLRLNTDHVLPYIAEMVPGPIYEMLEQLLKSLLENPDGSLLSVSALGTIWAASKSVNGLQRSLNKIYSVGKRSNFIVQRIYSIFMIFIFLIMIAFLFIFFGLGQMILDFLVPVFHIPPTMTKMFGTLKWPVTLFLLFFVMSMIYYFVPNAKIKFRYTLFGSVFATLSWMALTQIFSKLIKYFFKRITSYGIFGSFIIFMLWLNFAAKLILMGAILNAGIEEYRMGSIVQRENRIGQMVDHHVESFKSREKEKKSQEKNK